MRRLLKIAAPLILWPNCLPAAVVISNLTASIGTISLNSIPTGASATVNATLLWNILLSLVTSSWTISVQAGASSFTNCPSVPLSAVTVSCVSISDTGLIGANHSCGSSFALSTSNQVIASGSEAIGVLGTRTLVVRYTFADSWAYRGTTTPCSLALNYTLIAL